MSPVGRTGSTKIVKSSIISWMASRSSQGTMAPAISWAMSRQISLALTSKLAPAAESRPASAISSAPGDSATIIVNRMATTPKSKSRARTSAQKGPTSAASRFHSSGSRRSTTPPAGCFATPARRARWSRIAAARSRSMESPTSICLSTWTIAVIAGSVLRLVPELARLLESCARPRGSSHVNPRRRGRRRARWR